MQAHCFQAVSGAFEALGEPLPVRIPHHKGDGFSRDEFEAQTQVERTFEDSEGRWRKKWSWTKVQWRGLMGGHMKKELQILWNFCWSIEQTKPFNILFIKNNTLPIQKFGLFFRYDFLKFFKKNLLCSPELHLLLQSSVSHDEYIQYIYQKFVSFLPPCEHWMISTSVWSNLYLFLCLVCSGTDAGVFEIRGTSEEERLRWGSDRDSERGRKTSVYNTFGIGRNTRPK